MPTTCRRFRFDEHPEIRALMEACSDIQRQAIDCVLESNKNAERTAIKALRPPLRKEDPHLHPDPICGAIRFSEIRSLSIYLAWRTKKIKRDAEITPRFSPTREIRQPLRSLAIGRRLQCKRKRFGK